MGDHHDPVSHKGEGCTKGDPREETFSSRTEVDGLLGFFLCTWRGIARKRLSPRSCLIGVGLGSLLFGRGQDSMGSGGDEEEDNENDGICIMNIYQDVLGSGIGDPRSTCGRYVGGHV